MAEVRTRSMFAEASGGPAAAGPGGDPSLPRARPIRILVATASADEIDGVRRAVRAAGMDALVPGISKLGEAEEAGRVGEFDVILVGETLVGGSGLEFIRRMAGRQAVPVVALAARPDSPFAAEAMNQGAVDAVAFDGTDLPAAVDAVRRARSDRLRREADWEILLGRTLFDGLTRLPNRRSIEAHLGRALPVAIASGRPLAVLAFDIDGMGAVNDRYGRGVGDQLLTGVPALLTPVLRQGATLARSGADEFVLVAAETELAQGIEIGETVCRRFEAHEVRDPRGHVVRVTVSAGLAMGGRSPSSPSAGTLLGAATAAAARARSQGGGRLCIAVPGFSPARDGGGGPSHSSDPEGGHR